MKRIKLNLLILTGCILLVGCGEEKPRSSTEKVPAHNFNWDDVPETAPDLLRALESAAPGEPIIFTGRVGGTLEPIAKGFAGFVVADESLVFCDEMSEDDHCETPWDACCEDPDKINSARVFVQFNDEQGEPIMADLGEALGLIENDTVIVSGVVSPHGFPENPVIIADAVSVRE